MSRPISMEDGELKSVVKFRDGETYEHWRRGIDNIHHVHLACGSTIEFSHEESEGKVTIGNFVGIEK